MVTGKVVIETSRALKCHRSHNHYPFRAATNEQAMERVKLYQFTRQAIFGRSSRREVRQVCYPAPAHQSQIQFQPSQVFRPTFSMSSVKTSEFSGKPDF